MIRIKTVGGAGVPAQAPLPAPGAPVQRRNSQPRDMPDGLSARSPQPGAGVQRTPAPGAVLPGPEAEAISPARANRAEALVYAWARPRMNYPTLRSAVKQAAAGLSELLNAAARMRY